MKPLNFNHDYAIDPVETYKQKLTCYIETTRGMSNQSATELADKIIADRVQDPTLVTYYRPDGEDTNKHHVKFTDYLKMAFNNGRCLTPSGTIYENPKIRASYVSIQLSRWLKERSVVKKQSFIERMKGNTRKADKLFGLSLRLKGKANSVSGLFSTYSNVHCKSCHYTLTSTTAMATSIANVSNERFIIGNYNFRTPSTAVDYMTSCLAFMDVKRFREIMDKYQLMYINSTELMVIIKKSCLYYFSSRKFKKVATFIKTLSDIDATIIAYTGSFYHIRKYNDDFIFNMVERINSAVIDETAKNSTFEENIDFIESCDEDIKIAIHHRAYHDMKGVLQGYVLTDEDGEEKPIDKTIVEQIASSVRMMNNVMLEYKDLFDTIINTPIDPPAPAYFDEMVREAVVLSDTDSTCYTIEEWVDWYCNKVKRYNFAEALGITGLIGALASRTLTHHIVNLSRGMGIAEDKENIIAMKNEFTWVLFIRAANAAKHYLAGIVGQEGNIYPNTRREIKGVGLKGTNNSPMVLDEVYALGDLLLQRAINGLNDTTNNTTPISELVDAYERLRKKIITQLYNGDTSVLKEMTVKAPEQYSDPDPLKTNARYLIMWNTLFKSLHTAEYNEQFVKFPLMVHNKGDIDRFLEDMRKHVPVEDVDAMEQLLVKMNRKQLNVFYIPTEYLNNNSLPEFMKHWTDEESLLKGTTSPLILFLNSCGYFISDYKKDTNKPQ